MPVRPPKGNVKVGLGLKGDGKEAAASGAGVGCAGELGTLQIEMELVLQTICYASGIRFQIPVHHPISPTLQGKR